MAKAAAKAKTKSKRAPERREEALSGERIVDVAIELLDAEGEDGLTFRALATQLQTGAGAIYWHMANKSEILVAATDAVVTRAMAELHAPATPRDAIRALAAGLFDAIDEHPWVGAQLSRAPCEKATLQVFERLGREIRALDVPAALRFTAGGALFGYILGVSLQNAANRSAREAPVDRTEFLKSAASRWRELDPSEYPFAREVADRLPQHDDREEFLAGVDLILAGIAASASEASRRRGRPKS